MPSNISAVSFASSPLSMSPDPAIEQGQLQHQHELAQALRAQSMRDIPSDSDRISWTQGPAKLGEAVAANHAEMHANAAAWDVAARAQNAQAAIQDPARISIRQIDLTQNPYLASEQGRDLGQRLKTFIDGGPPASADARALAGGLLPTTGAENRARRSRRAAGLRASSAVRGERTS